MIAFVEADVLSSRGWLSAVYWNVIKGGFKKFDIVGVGPADLDSQGNSASVSEYRTLGSQFAPIRRVSACIFPRPEAI